MVANTSVMIEVLEILVRGSSCPRYKCGEDDSIDEDDEGDIEIIEESCDLALPGEKIEIPFDQVEAVQNEVSFLLS